jgi:hypothetical protein
MEPRKQAIIDALSTWIRQRPGLEYANYGDVTSYRAECRSIARDKREAETLLAAVKWRDGITADDVIAAARSAYSGRLTIRMEWGWQLVETDTRGKPVGVMTGFDTEAEALARLAEWRAAGRPQADRNHAQPARNRAVIDYCTGQYWPTEYRRAVCAVLASALWEYTRNTMPAPNGFRVREWGNRNVSWGPYATHAEAVAKRAALALPTGREAEGWGGLDQTYGPSRVSAGDWLRAHFRKEFGRGIADRWFS